MSHIHRLPHGILVDLPQQTRKNLQTLSRDFMKNFTREISNVIEDLPNLTPTIQRIYIDEQFIALINNLTATYFEVMQKTMLQIAKGENF